MPDNCRSLRSKKATVEPIISDYRLSQVLKPSCISMAVGLEGGGRFSQVFLYKVIISKSKTRCLN